MGSPISPHDPLKTPLIPDNQVEKKKNFNFLSCLACLIPSFIKNFFNRTKKIERENITPPPGVAEKITSTPAVQSITQQKPITPPPVAAEKITSNPIQSNPVAPPIIQEKPVLTSYDKGHTLDDNEVKARAQHYREKYGIDIQVLSTPAELQASLDDLYSKSDEQPQIRGIVYLPEKHSTPILINFSKEKKEILDLDVISGTRGSNDLQSSIADKSDIKIYRSSARQADSFSCRTESLTILRNSLLYIKYHRQKQPEEPFGISDLFLKGDKIILPDCIRYTAQIFRNPEEKYASVIRDRFSNEAFKQTHPKSVAEFRERFTFEHSAIRNTKIKKNAYLKYKGVEISGNKNLYDSSDVLLNYIRVQKEVYRAAHGVLFE